MFIKTAKTLCMHYVSEFLRGLCPNLLHVLALFILLIKKKNNNKAE